MATKGYEPVLNETNQRVTLKIDVSHVDHSYIIGRKGQQIQSIMNTTNCHIHFPDGNKNRTSEKSNQVTISGFAANAERARQLVRQCLLVHISFDIPITGENILLIDNSHPNLQFIQKKYNVMISFTYKQEIGDFVSPITTASMKGLKTKFNDFKEAMLAFWIHLTGSEKGFNGVYMKIQIEIATQNQRFVQGKGNCNIKTINSQTGAIVIFPNIIPSSDSTLERNNSTVEIRGKGMDSVFLGWLHILAFLPMVLIFDIQPDMELDSKLMTNLMSNLPINISIRYKNRSSLKKIVLKCYEKNSSILLEAYSQLLNNQMRQMPQTYHNQFSFEPKLSNFEECLNRSFSNMNIEISRSEQLTYQSPNKYDFYNTTSLSLLTSQVDTSRSLKPYGAETLPIPWTSQISDGFGDNLKELESQQRGFADRIWSNVTLSSSLTNSMFEDRKKGAENQIKTEIDASQSDNYDYFWRHF